MGRITLIDKQFETRDLDPFGAEWTPTNGALHTQAWATKAPEEVRKAVKDNALLLIRNTETRETDSWSEIPNSSSKGSTQILHVDDIGRPKVLLWKFDGKERSPIAFAKGDKVAEAIHNNAPLLSHEFEQDLAEDPFATTLNTMAENASTEPINIDVRAIHFQMVRLLNDRIMEQSLAVINSKYSGPSLMGFIKHVLHRPPPEPKRDISAEAREICIQHIERLIDAIHAQVNGDTFIHDWTERPDTSVLVHNHYQENDPDRNEKVAMHWGVVDDALENQDPIKRVLLRGDKFSQS